MAGRLEVEEVHVSKRHLIHLAETPNQTKPEEKESGVGRWILKLMACGTTSYVKMETEKEVLVKEKEESSGSIVPPFNESNQER